EPRLLGIDRRKDRRSSWGCADLNVRVDVTGRARAGSGGRDGANSRQPGGIVIGPVEVAADAVGILAVQHRQRHAGLERRDAGELPASGDTADQSVLLAHPRQLVQVGERGAMRTVEQRRPTLASLTAEDRRHRRLLRLVVTRDAEYFAG